MAKSQPKWRRVFDSAERKIGAPLESAVTSHRFVGVMSVGIRAKNAVTGKAGRVVGSVLHKVNIATRDDVQRVNQKMSELAREVRTAEPAPPLKSVSSARSAKTTKATRTAKAAKTAKRTKTPGQDDGASG